MSTARMREAHSVGCAGSGAAAAPGAAGWLGLAAAPTFAVMALWTGYSGLEADVLCMSSHSALSLHGMAAMYALMCVFHLAPWLKLVSDRRPGAHLS